MNISTNIHKVKCIELTMHQPENNNARIMRITMQNDTQIDICCFGCTDALDILPKSDDYVSRTL